MNIIKMIFRSKSTISVDVFEAWNVRWMSRYDAWHSSIRPEIRVFTTHEDAKEFAAALRCAFKLIKHTSGNEVYIEKQII